MTLFPHEQKKDFMSNLDPIFQNILDSHFPKGEEIMNTKSQGDAAQNLGIPSTNEARNGATELSAAPSLAGTPFIVANGSLFEVHDYEFDADGRRWEITVAGPFDSDTNKDILNAVREFRGESE